jgi:hypothetical protein
MMSPKPHIYTPEEVNALLPQLAPLLPELRRLREAIIHTQQKSDIEEVTSHGASGTLARKARHQIEEYRAKIKSHERNFEKTLKIFEKAGCEIKGLEPGLVDFYSERDGELIYLCWREDEKTIGFWHSIGGGFAGRQPL